MTDALALVKRHMDQDLQILAPSEEFMQAIETFEQEIGLEADRRVAHALGDTKATGAERAALKAEMTLSVLRDVGYIMTETTADTLETLDRGELWASHPSSPKTADELHEAHGISKSEAWDLHTFRTLIFPWLEKNLGMHRYEVTRRLGPRKMRRIAPILKRLLDPEGARKSDKLDQAAESLEKMVDEAIVMEKVIEALEQEEPDEMDQQIIEEAGALGQVTPETAEVLLEEFNKENPEFNREVAKAGLLLSMAETQTHKDLEYGLSPERTPPIPAQVTKHEIRTIDEDGGIVVEGEVYKLSSTMSPDQWDLLQKRFSDGRMIIAFQTGDPITKE
jgi:hypothetical protein